MWGELAPPTAPKSACAMDLVIQSADDDEQGDQHGDAHRDPEQRVDPGAAAPVAMPAPGAASPPVPGHAPSSSVDCTAGLERSQPSSLPDPTVGGCVPGPGPTGPPPSPPCSGWCSPGPAGRWRRCWPGTPSTGG